MGDLTRRSFLEHTLAVASAGLAASVAEGARISGDQPQPTTRPTSKVPKGQRIGIAVIGLHGRGLNHIEGYTDRLLSDEGVEVVAICDPDQNTFANAQKILQERGREPAKQYTDIRKLLDDKDVRAVSIA